MSPDHWLVEDAPRCPLCACEHSRAILRGRDRLHGLPGEFGVVQCTECGALRTSPRPTMDCLERYYPPDYEPHEAAASRPRTRDRAVDVLRLRLLKSMFGYRHLAVRDLSPLSLRFWSLFFQRPPLRLPRFRGSGRALDVGCGSGSDLLRLRTYGWSVLGVDVCEPAVARARALGLEVIHGTIASLAEDSRTFDLIRLASVIEHVPDPVETLTRARQKLAPDGRVLLILPNAGSPAFRWFETYWFQLELPRHLMHFNARTIALAAEKAGLVVERIEFDSSPRGLMRSLANRFPRWERVFRSRFARRVFSPFARILDVLGQGDSMNVTLRSPTPSSP